VLKHSLLTVARPCGNSTRFPFHSQDCREHLALTSANASKPVSPGQFSHGEASLTAKLSGTRGIFWQGGAGAAGSHLRDAAFAPLRIDCGLRPCLCKLSRMAKADAVAGTPVWRRRNYLPPPTRLNDYAKYSMGLRPRLSAAAASPLVSKPWVPGARGENTWRPFLPVATISPLVPRCSNSGEKGSGCNSRTVAPLWSASSPAKQATVASGNGKAAGRASQLSVRRPALGLTRHAAHESGWVEHAHRFSVPPILALLFRPLFTCSVAC